MHRVRGFEVSSINETLLFPYFEPPIRKGAGKRFFPWVVLGVPVNGNSKGVERKPVSISNVSEIESSPVLVQVPFMEPPLYLPIRGFFPDLLFRVIPNGGKSGNEWAFDKFM